MTARPAPEEALFARANGMTVPQYRDMLASEAAEAEMSETAPQTEPEWLTRLRTEIDAEVVHVINERDLPFIAADAEAVADRATGVAASYLHPLHARVAELEADVRSLGGDPDRMVDPGDHEAAIAAMRDEMHGRGRMGSRIGVNDACDIAEEHMLRMAQGALSTPGGEALSDDEGRSARARVVLAQVVEGMEADSERWDGEPMSEANVTARFGEVRAEIAVLAGVVSALTQPSNPHGGNPVSQVREVPDPLFAAHVGYPDIEAMTRARMAGLAALSVREVPAGEARVGDTVTEVRTGRVIKSGDDLFEVEWSDGAGAFYKRAEAGHLTVTRPSIPLPTAPGAVGTATVRGIPDAPVFRVYSDTEPDRRAWVTTGGSVLGGAVWLRNDEVGDFKPSAAGLPKGGKA